MPDKRVSEKLAERKVGAGRVGKKRAVRRDVHEPEDGETDVDPEVGEEPSLDEHR